MATLESGETNIIEAEAVNWRVVVFPVVGAVILVLLGFGYYYYLQSQRLDREAAAQDAIANAKTPDDYLKVADSYSDTTHATMALIGAGEASYEKKDFDGAIKSYQRVTTNGSTEPELHDTAELGLGAALEASGKNDDAIEAYMTVGRRGSESAFAPYAYSAVARIYGQRHDKDNERRILNSLAALPAQDSPFVREASQRLKELNAATDAALMGAPVTTAPAAAPTAETNVPAAAATTNAPAAK